jgi:hypothetical protein
MIDSTEVLKRDEQLAWSIRRETDARVLETPDRGLLDVQ